MKANDTSPQRHARIHSLPQRMTAGPSLLGGEEPESHSPKLEEGFQHIVRSLKEGKSFRQMQKAWRMKHKK